MKSRIYSLLLAALACLCATAADADRHINVAFDVRADYTVQAFDNHNKNLSGFHGRYLNLMLNGTINSKLSYSWRQRMNKYIQSESDMFAATDWVYLRYQPAEHWAFSAGKQVVMIGGFEYDAAPINIFFASRFWNNIACYQFGVSGTYITSDGNHQLSAQITNSPYYNTQGKGYAYNLYWAGHMGRWSTLWSVNMLEYQQGLFANFIALGNRFDLGPVVADIDLMNRATDRHQFIAGDYSVIGKLTWTATPWLTVFAKGGYDEFKPLPGLPDHVDNPFYGGGLEFYPMHGSRDLRIHAVCDCVSDNEGVHCTEFNVGLTWRVTLLDK